MEKKRQKERKKKDKAGGIRLAYTTLERFAPYAEGKEKEN